MTTSTPSVPTAARPALSTANQVGLGLAGLLGLLDLASIPGGPMSASPDPGQPGPPSGILWFDAAMGVLTIAFVVLAWRTGSRAASRVVAAARLLSVFTAWPAFFVDGIPAPVVALVAVATLLTAAAIYLVLRRPAPAVEEAVR